MFQLLASTQELFLVNGMSEEGARKAEIAKNADLIDFCTTTYSSVKNREYCIDKFVRPSFNYMQW